MCLIALAYRVHPDYPLVLVANRDEYYQRPTQVAGWWSDSPDVLAGRDQSGGGTWLGVTRSGRWAAVTNYRDGNAESAMRSRGDLVRAFLQGSQSAAAYADAVARNGSLYGGFNLLLGSPGELVYCSNRTPGIRAVAPGVHTLSNHLLDTSWPKARLARQNLVARLRCRGAVTPRQLLPLLAHRGRFADHLLPSTGVEIEWERALSAPFIVTEDYGTRCTSVLLLNASHQVSFLEQTYVAGVAVDGPREFRFAMSPDGIGAAD